MTVTLILTRIDKHSLTVLRAPGRYAISSPLPVELSLLLRFNLGGLGYLRKVRKKPALEVERTNHLLQLSSSLEPRRAQLGSSPAEKDRLSPLGSFLEHAAG